MPGYSRADLVEDAVPELVRVPHGVRLVGHVHARSPVRLRVLEGRADDALDALARVHVLVDGDLVGRAALELAADADVDALGVLAEHDEVDVLRVVAL